MNELKYYYNFGEINPTDEKIPVEYELVSFDEFDSGLQRFKIAQQEKKLDAVQPAVNVWLKDDNINGITMISAFYSLGKGLFSKEIKTDEFVVAVKVLSENGKISEYLWSSKDYEKFKSIFFEFIVNQRTPDLDDASWTKNVFI